MAEMDTSSDSGKGDGKVRAKKQSARVDMTPMVDLGFLLITFFVFTTTFSKPNMMKLNMPEKDKDKEKEPETAEIKESNTITILMGKDNRIFYHQKSSKNLTPELLMESDYSKDGIRTAILKGKVNAISPEKFTVVIKPTDDANYKNTVDILDEMSITKSELYAIVDPSKEEMEIYKQKIASPKQ
jgi:biopolymer transport protein ExbD